jgi:hypothetical protein
MEATVSGKAPSLEDAVPPARAGLGDEDGGVGVDGVESGGAGADAGGVAVSGGGLEGAMPLWRKSHRTRSSSELSPLSGDVGSCWPEAVGQRHKHKSTLKSPATADRPMNAGCDVAAAMCPAGRAQWCATKGISACITLRVESSRGTAGNPPLSARPEARTAACVESVTARHLREVVELVWCCRWQRAKSRTVTRPPRRSGRAPLHPTRGRSSCRR